MDELSHEARRFIAAALDDDAPSLHESDKTWDEIVAVVTGAAISTAPSSTTTAVGGRRRWIRWLVIAIAIACAIAWWARSGADRSGPAEPAIVARPRPSPDAVQADVEAPRSEADTQAILTRAETALREGRPAEALDLLEQHAELDPTGPDSERRMARRIAALCALGRADRASAEATGFLARHGASSFAAEVRAGCTGAPGQDR